jgi:hypothetical protein
MGNADGFTRATCTTSAIGNTKIELKFSPKKLEIRIKFSYRS